MLELFWLTFSIFFGIFCLIKHERHKNPYHPSGYFILFIVQFLTFHALALIPFISNIFEYLINFYPKTGSFINGFTAVVTCFSFPIASIFIQFKLSKFIYFNNFSSYYLNLKWKKFKTNIKLKKSLKIKEKNTVKNF